MENNCVSEHAKHLAALQAERGPHHVHGAALDYAIEHLQNCTSIELLHAKAGVCDAQRHYTAAVSRADSVDIAIAYDQLRTARETLETLENKYGK